MTEDRDYWEVQHFTLLEGWVNCWSDIADDDSETPTTYPTFADAESALDIFFDERRDEDPSQYRIALFKDGEFIGAFSYDYVFTYEGEKPQ